LTIYHLHFSISFSQFVLYHFVAFCQLLYTNIWIWICCFDGWTRLTVLSLPTALAQQGRQQGRHSGQYFRLNCPTTRGLHAAL